jgi:acyl dehydratase
VSDSRRYCGGAVDGCAATVFNQANILRNCNPVSRLYWEDFSPGRVFEHGPRRLPRDEMIAFAAEFDPQPMHLDEIAARETMLGGIAASGWYLCCILMQMCAESFVLNSSSMGAPGVEEVKWLKPVRPDRGASSSRDRARNARLEEPAGHGFRALRV